MSEPLSDAALDQLFRSARTYNGYLDKPVSTAQLHAIWDLVKMGPTSANCLPARLIWCTSDAAKARLAACAMPANADKIRTAPVSVIIGMDTHFYDHLPQLFPHTDARSWFAGNDVLAAATMFRNSSLQGAYLILAARALGLDTGPMSGFDAAGVEAAFFADTPQVKANFIATLGYGDPGSIFDRSPRPDFAQFNQTA
ncbi:MAG: malonic semialdehyde reductase [Sphingopyxis sp.]